MPIFLPTGLKGTLPSQDCVFAPGRKESWESTNGERQMGDAKRGISEEASSRAPNLEGKLLSSGEAIVGMFLRDKMHLLLILSPFRDLGFCVPWASASRARRGEGFPPDTTCLQLLSHQPSLEPPSSVTIAHMFELDTKTRTCRKSSGGVYIFLVEVSILPRFLIHIQ